MGFLDSLGSVLDTVGKVANVATTGYNLWSGINNANAASDYYDLVAGSAELQDTIAKDQWAIGKPLMTKQGELTSMELGKAQTNLPGLLDKQYSLAGKTLDANAADLALYDQSRGVLSKFFTESENGIDPAAEMNRAGSAVEMAMAGAEEQNARNLARRGVRMDSGQATAASQAAAIQKALGKAGARTNAWNAARDTNYARLGNAANVRAGMSANADIPSTPSISLGNPATTASSAGSTAASLAQGASTAATQAFNDVGYTLTRQH